ncbi:MAG TPA: hypothetical protein VFU47_16175 [Armatimonadota bacterium]|nr:hypothetical protein [Armatimonadota bacterium]
MSDVKGISDALPAQDAGGGLARIFVFGAVVGCGVGATLGSIVAHLALSVTHPGQMELLPRAMIFRGGPIGAVAGTLLGALIAAFFYWRETRRSRS